MKRMLTLSLMIHLAGAMLFVFLVWIGERRFESSVYTVNLITPAPQIRTTPAEPKREEAPKVAKPAPVKPAPPKKVVKHLLDPAPPERKVEKLKKQVPSPKPAKPVAQPPAPSPEPETASSTKPQPSAAPAPSEEAALPKPVAKAVMDVPHFKFPIYGAMIEKRISALWSPPALAIESEGKETVVSFQLNKTGQVKDVQIEQSSGNIYYDQAALRAVYEAEPFPPWPQGLHEPSLKIYFRFWLGKEG
jgi:protein TonB